MTAQLIKKGRSVLFLTILLTQKGTSDAIPTAIRDNAGLGFSFAVKTKDAAVAGLKVILNNVSAQVNLAYNAIATDRERTRLNSVAAGQARENLRVVVVRYNNGVPSRPRSWTPRPP